MTQSAQSPELQAKIDQWRIKSLQGTLTIEEQKEAIKAMRQDRITAGQTAKKSRSKGPIRDADSMLSGLLG